MTTTNFNNRRGAQSSLAPAKKSRSRIQNNGIVAGSFIPFKVINAEDGGESKFSDYSTHFELEHLATKAKIKTVVFGDVLPNSVDSKILDCILSPDVQAYDPEDLIGGYFEAILSFNTQGNKTYINITDVQPLQPQSKQLLKQQKQKEQLAQKQTSANISAVEEEMDDIGLFSEEETFNKPTKNKTSSVTADMDEEVEETFETDEEEIETDFFFCDACQDKGCEECDLNLDEGADDELEYVPDDSCPHCDNLGCDICEED